MDQMSSMVSMVANLGSDLEDDPLADLEGLLAMRGELLAEAAVGQAASTLLRSLGRVPRDKLRPALHDRLLPLLKEPLTAEDVATACSAAVDRCGPECDAEAIQSCYVHAVSALLDRAKEVTAAAPLPGRPPTHRNAVPTAVVPMAALARVHRAAAAGEAAAGGLQLHLGWRALVAQTASCVIRTWLCGFLLGGTCLFSAMLGGYLLESAPWLGRGPQLRRRVAAIFTLWYFSFSFGLYCIFAREQVAAGAPKGVLVQCLAGNALQILAVAALVALLVELAEVEPSVTVTITGAGQCLMILAWVFMLVRGVARDPVRQAAVQARALLQGSQPRAPPLAKLVLLQSLPLLMIVVMGYTFTAIFAMTRANSMGKAVLFVVALLVKVFGNKLLVSLFRIGYVKSPGSFTVDFMLFSYEFSGGILTRMIVLSVPDASVSLAVSLASTLVELLTRLGMLHSYLVAGMSRESWTERDWVAYNRRGRLYVADAQNDQIVEYASSAAAVSVLIFLSCPAGGLECGGGDGRIRQLLLISGAQWMLEGLCDVFGTCLEVHGGLGPHLRHFWTAQCSVKVAAAKHLLVNAVMGIVPVLLMSGR